jgi:hypothetical protein
VVLHYEWGAPTDDQTRVLSVGTVGELKWIVLRARTDPRIASYRYWRHRDWDPTDVPDRCPRGHDYIPAGTSDVSCCCGDGHRILRCHAHNSVVICPPFGPGCAPIPIEPAR